MEISRARRTLHLDTKNKSRIFLFGSILFRISENFILFVLKTDSIIYPKGYRFWNKSRNIVWNVVTTLTIGTLIYKGFCRHFHGRLKIIRIPRTYIIRHRFCMQIVCKSYVSHRRIDALPKNHNGDLLLTNSSQCWAYLCVSTRKETAVPKSRGEPLQIALDLYA